MTREEETALRAELARALRREEQVRAELQRRVTNMLASIRSVFSRTMAASGSHEEASHHFQDRLASYARTQAALLRSPSASVELEDLVRDELLDVQLTDGPRLRIDGPPVCLQGQLAEVIALALHELATNAAKFGMLSNDVGRLDVRWSIQPRPDGERLNFSWREHGVDARPSVPMHCGFGCDLITAGLPYQVGADTRFDLLADGLRCDIGLMLPSNAGARHAGPAHPSLSLVRSHHADDLVEQRR